MRELFVSHSYIYFLEFIFENVRALSGKTRYIFFICCGLALKIQNFGGKLKKNCETEWIFIYSILSHGAFYCSSLLFSVRSSSSAVFFCGISIFANIFSKLFVTLIIFRCFPIAKNDARNTIHVPSDYSSRNQSRYCYTLLNFCYINTHDSFWWRTDFFFFFFYSAVKRFMCIRVHVRVIWIPK